MSKTQLQTNNTRLASLIDELKDKAAGDGGTSLDTCTVTIEINNALYLKSVVATVFSNDDIDSVYILKQNGESHGETIENVVCGSFIHIQIYNLPMEFGNTVSGAEYIRHYDREGCFKITANANETATITIYDND